MFYQFWQSYGPWHLECLHILACLLHSSYMDFYETWQGYCTTSLEVHVGGGGVILIHVQQILAELWPLTLRIFTHFSLSSQFLLHPCMNLNETWQGCYTTSLEKHVGRLFMFDKFWQCYGPWHLEVFTHFILSSQLLLHPCMDLNETW